MIGWPVAWKCLVACLFGELSQQPTWPQVRQSRRCTQREPVFRHSSQPSALGVTSWMSAACLQPCAIVPSLLMDRAEIGMQRCNDLRPFSDRRGHPLDRTGADIADREHAG